MMVEPSGIALISTSSGSIEALGISISGVELGSISIKSGVCAFSFNEYYSILLYFCVFNIAKSLLISTQSFISIVWFNIKSTSALFFHLFN